MHSLSSTDIYASKRRSIQNLNYDQMAKLNHVNRPIDRRGPLFLPLLAA